MNDGTARQRAALLRLLAQPTAQDRRPCAGCTSTCGCERRSTFCCCACSPECALAPTVLSRHPERRPVEATFVPLLYELGALRLIEPVWPESNSYCRAPSRSSTPSIQFRCELHYAALVAHHLHYLGTIGALSTPWHVSLVAHLAGAAQCSFAIEPSNATGDLQGQRDDVRRIGSHFAEKVRQIARLRLRVLEMWRVTPQGAKPSAPITPREAEVLDLFLSGLGVASISKRLFISPHTVRNHMKQLFAKFGVTSQRELREHFADVAPSRN